MLKWGADVGGRGLPGGRGLSLLCPLGWVDWDWDGWSWMRVGVGVGVGLGAISLSPKCYPVATPPSRVSSLSGCAPLQSYNPLKSTIYLRWTYVQEILVHRSLNYIVLLSAL